MSMRQPNIEHWGVLVNFLVITTIGSFLCSTGALAAAPSQNPEEAVVFLDVYIESFDGTMNEPHRTKIGEGSGVLVNPEGWVVTAKHVITAEFSENTKLVIEGSIRSRFASKYPMEVIRGGPVDSDVAILRFPIGLGITFPYLCTIRNPQLNNKDDVIALGFPLGLELSVRPGKITSLSGPRGLVQTNLGLARGMSGGPVINDRQAIVGIVYGGIEDQNNFDYFIPANLAIPLLDIPPAAYEGETCGLKHNVQPDTERTYDVNETFDDHVGLGPSSRQYVIHKTADPGFVIRDAKFVGQSEARVSDLTINISQDRRTAELKFKLASGPAYNRWIGWLHGRFILFLQARE